MNTTAPEFYVIPKTKRRFKGMSEQLLCHVEGEVKALLHECRDSMRNREANTRQSAWDCMDGWYGEAYGVMRALQFMGYGYFGPVNLDAIQQGRAECEPRHNLRWWFERLAAEVLEEENFGGSGECDYCFSVHMKDDSRIMQCGEARQRSAIWDR